MKERLIVHSLNSGVDYRSQSKFDVKIPPPPSQFTKYLLLSLNPCDLELKPMKTYWTPNDEASSVQINEIWVKLCAGKQGI